MGTQEDNGGIKSSWGDFPAGTVMTTRASLDEDNRVVETITVDVDFNDGEWRPASQVMAGDVPALGSEHPGIEGCFLANVSASHRNNQGDLIRAVLEYRYPNVTRDPSGEGGGGGRGDSPTTPLDERFLINFNPVVTQNPLGEDLNGKKICNANGEPYDRSFPTVRLDGTCTWTQKNWNQSNITKWVGVVNSKTWSPGEYKFDARTVICNYVVGNLAFFINDDGKQESYYKMQASISYYPEAIVDKEFNTEIRSQGSFYYEDILDKNSDINRMPKDRTGKFVYDITSGTGLLKSGKRDEPVVKLPDYDKFKIYEPTVFNFVDRAN